MTRLSIIVPSLDEEATIARSMVALQPLRARGHEVIIVDGGSRDGTVRLARPFADRIIESSAGRALQMNRGARAASNQVLLFLHADSLLPGDAEVAIHTALERGAKWGRFDVTIDGRARVLKMVAAMMNHRSRLTGIATGDQGIFVTRELFHQVGGYPVIPLMEDVALSKTLKRRSGSPACLRSRIVTSGRRWESHGPWRTIFGMWRLRLAYALGADPARLARMYR